MSSDYESDFDIEDSGSASLASEVVKPLGKPPLPGRPPSAADKPQPVGFRSTSQPSTASVGRRSVSPVGSIGGSEVLEPPPELEPPPVITPAMEAMHARWLKEAEEEKQAAELAEKETLEAQRAEYMDFFFSATSSQDVLEYQWPGSTVPEHDNRVWSPPRLPIPLPHQAFAVTRPRSTSPSLLSPTKRFSLQPVAPAKPPKFDLFGHEEGHAPPAVARTTRKNALHRPLSRPTSTGRRPTTAAPSRSPSPPSRPQTALASRRRSSAKTLPHAAARPSSALAAPRRRGGGGGGQPSPPRSRPSTAHSQRDVADLDPYTPQWPLPHPETFGMRHVGMRGWIVALKGGPQADGGSGSEGEDEEASELPMVYAAVWRNSILYLFNSASDCETFFQGGAEGVGFLRGWFDLESVVSVRLTTIAWRLGGDTPQGEWASPKHRKLLTAVALAGPHGVFYVTPHPVHASEFATMSLMRCEAATTHAKQAVGANPDDEACVARAALSAHLSKRAAVRAEHAVEEAARVWRRTLLVATQLRRSVIASVMSQPGVSAGENMDVSALLPSTGKMLHALTVAKQSKLQSPYADTASKLSRAMPSLKYLSPYDELPCGGDVGGLNSSSRVFDLDGALPQLSTSASRASIAATTHPVPLHVGIVSHVFDAHGLLRSHGTSFGADLFVYFALDDAPPGIGVGDVVVYAPAPRYLPGTGVTPKPYTATDLVVTMPAPLFAAVGDIQLVNAPPRPNAADEWCTWAEPASRRSRSKAVDPATFSTPWAEPPAPHRRRSAVAAAVHVARVHRASPTPA